MHKCKNIAITGAKGRGKSTLARLLVTRLGQPCCGFETRRYGVTDQGPLYEMVDLLTGSAAPISRLTEEGIRGIPESFEGFGAELLENLLRCPEPLVLLDEIGRFERTSARFLAALDRVLDSPKPVIAVLKQEALPHIGAIKARADTLVVDLDTVSREEAYALVCGSAAGGRAMPAPAGECGIL